MSNAASDEGPRVERAMRRLADEIARDGEATGAPVVPTIAWGLDVRAASPSPHILVR